MELLTKKYGEGRGRAASNSTIDYTNLVNHFGFDTVDQAFIRLVELGSPYIKLRKSAGEWTGTKGGLEKVVKRDAERIGLKASFSAPDKAEKGDVFIFTIRQGDGVEMATVEVATEGSEEE